MIYIGNLHKGQEHTLRRGVVVRCDRGHSVLSNPFKVTSEDKRDWSCDQYQKYFDKKVREKKDSAFMNELRRIYHLALKQDIVLACWCYPKRCHTQTIKTFLESYLKQNNQYKQRRGANKYRAPKPQNGLDDEEKKRLEWLIKKGCDENKRKGIAWKFIQEWHHIVGAGEMTPRQFVEAQYKYCVTNYSRRFADKFAFKVVCVLDQVRVIDKRFSRWFESDGTIALSGFHNPKDAGMRYQAYVIIHWKDEKVKPVKITPDGKALQAQADEFLPDELKSTNMHLYRESREDHSWLEGIQEERARKEEEAEKERLLKQLKDKYKK